MSYESLYEESLQPPVNQYRCFSSEVERRLCKQSLNGHETTHTVSSSDTMDFNDLTLTLDGVTLFMKRIQTASVTQILIVLFSFKVYFILT